MCVIYTYFTDLFSVLSTYITCFLILTPYTLKVKIDIGKLSVHLILKSEYISITYSPKNYKSIHLDFSVMLSIYNVTCVWPGQLVGEGLQGL